MNSNQSGYKVTNLASNNPSNSPQLLDPYLSLGWGIAIRPAGLGGHFWINNSGTGTVTEYVGDVGGTPIFQDVLKVVEVTPAALNPFGLSGPTGQVFNGSDDFVITQDNPNGEITAPSKFIFVASDGSISGWTERRNDDGTVDRPLVSEVVVDKFGDSIYYGAAITDFEDNNRLYAVDFGPTPGIEVFDAEFNEITPNFEFSNPFADEGYAPYNIQNIDGSLFVAYAIPSPEIPGDEVIEAGLGRVAEFDLDGNLVATWDDNELLNAPWGFVKAPETFGQYSNMLLVSNFGDGTIVAFDPETRAAVDYLRDGDGNPIAIDGLWGLVFGNGGSLGETNDLYFAAGNDLGDNAGDGVFGKVEVAADIDEITPGGDLTFEGTAGDDLFVVSGDDNTFLLGDGNDTVTARGLNQTIEAGDGDDILSIGSGVVDLGEGTNFVAASDDSSTVAGGTGDDTVNQVQGDLTADVGEGNNHITSGSGDDVVTAGSGDDFTYAGAGTNTLNLGDGDNTVYTVVNQGNFLTSVGQTTATTGSGSDTFVVGPGEGVVTITNFDESDRLELLGFKSDFTAALEFSDLTIDQVDADTVITLSGTEDVLAVLQNVSADSITASTFGEPEETEVPVVSFEATPSSVSEAGSEAERTITLQYTVVGDIPEGGLSVLVSIDNLEAFSALRLEPDIVDVTNIEFGQVFEDINAFETILLDQVSSYGIVVTDDIVQEEDVTLDLFELLPDSDGVLGTPYVVDPEASISTISFTDGIDDFPATPTVSLTADTTEVLEGEEVTFTFNVDGDLPADGLTVAIGSMTGTAALEFDPAILGETPTGFAGSPLVTGDNVLLTLTNPTASVTLKLAEDGIEEGTETVNVFLQDGELYEVDEANSSVDLSVSDGSSSAPDIVGTENSEKLLGNSDGNIIDALGGDDRIFSRAGNDTVSGGDGNDRVFAGFGFDLISGDGGDDILRGQEGNDTISGGDGNDSIFGGARNDLLSGDAGDDAIFGNQGNDLLMGVTGNDTLSGGGGNDTFVFGSGDGTDTITDFNVRQDFIGLVEGELTFADLEISEVGSRTVLGVLSTGETLANLIGVKANDLTEDRFVSVPDISDLSSVPDGGLLS